MMLSAGLLREAAHRCRGAGRLLVFFSTASAGMDGAMEGPGTEDRAGSRAAGHHGEPGVPVMTSARTPIANYRNTPISAVVIRYAAASPVGGNCVSGCSPHGRVDLREGGHP
jgi:hypothetical protein